MHSKKVELMSLLSLSISDFNCINNKNRLLREHEVLARLIKGLKEMTKMINPSNICQCKNGLMPNVK